MRARQVQVVHARAAHRLPWATRWLAITLCAACSSSSSDPGPDDPGGPHADGLVGAFAVRLRAADGVIAASSVVGGNVYDGPTPNATPLEVALEEGACQLLKVKLPFCAGGCGSAAVCAADDICVPYPKVQNVGIVRVEGLGAATVVLDPFPPSFVYESMPLPYPPCDDGSEVRLVADRFSATTHCIAPLVIASGVISVRRDNPVRLAWTPPAGGDVGSVQIRLDVSHHGGKKGEIACDVPDSGGFEIPATLVTPLVDLGLAGFPSVSMTRAASAPSRVEPRVTFSVSATVEREVDTGVQSCLEDQQCSEGRHCDKTTLFCQ